MLVYHQFVHCKVLANHLVCPMHSHMSGVNINELPKFSVDDTDDNTHAIIASDPLNPDQPLIIILILKGVKIYFPSREPRASEYENESIPHKDMTSEVLVWEPSEASF